MAQPKYIITSNLMVISTGAIPTTATLPIQHMAFGKVGDKYHLFGNSDGHVVSLLDEATGNLDLDAVLAIGNSSDISIKLTGDAKVSAEGGFEDDGASVLSASDKELGDGEAYIMREKLAVHSKADISDMLSSVFNFCGVVENKAALNALTGMKVGDAYQVQKSTGKDGAAGKIFAWMGEPDGADKGWVMLSAVIDLDGYFTKEEIEDFLDNIRDRIDELETEFDSKLEDLKTEIDEEFDAHSTRITTAQQRADAAYAAAGAAQSTANTALANAATADGKAVAAQQAADAAQATADEALADAAAAQAAADAAQAAADAAQGDATDALADAAAAQARADAAYAAAGVADGKAVAAQARADEALAAAAAAQSAADAAQVAANNAQSAADAAQATANTALANAAIADGKAVAAQQTADEAKVAAEEAHDAADLAHAAANTAQQAANAAQAAADAAQAAADEALAMTLSDVVNNGHELNGAQATNVRNSLNVYNRTEVYTKTEVDNLIPTVEFVIEEI